MSSEIVVRIEHVRSAKLCMRGVRQWFVRYGFDWRDFLENGLPISSVEATGCPLGARVAAEARKGTKRVNR